MVSITLPYKSFNRRLYNDFHSLAPWLVALPVALLAGIIPSLAFAVLLVSLTLSNSYRWHSYFIARAEVEGSHIYLQVYRRNMIFIDGTFDTSEINIRLKQIVNRGITYRLDCRIAGRSFTQYMVDGWNAENFKTLVSALEQA